MKITGRFLLLAGAMLLLLSGCDGGSNQEAKHLHAEACRMMDQCRECTQSYTEVLRVYREASQRIEQILAEHPDSKMARGLVSGELSIGGLTLDPFREMRASLEELARAEKSPLACALLLARKKGQLPAKAAALRDIAGLRAKRGQKNQAVELLSETLDCVSRLESPEQRFRGLVWIADVYAEIGQAKEASKILAEVVDATCAPAQEEWKMNRFQAMLAVACADAGEFSLARRVIGILRDGDVKNEAVHELAAKAVKAGRDEYAASLIAELMAPIEAIQHPEHRPLQESVALTKIAASYADAGLRDEALQILAQAHEAAMAIERTETLVKIADLYVTLEEPDKGSRLLAECLDLESASGDSCENARLGRATRFTEIAGVQVRMGHEGDALKLLSLALDLVETLEHPGSRSYGLLEIAAIHAIMGKRDKVLQLLSQALFSAKEIPVHRESNGDDAFNQIAGLYAETGEIGQALDVAMLMEDEFLIYLVVSDIVDACANGDALDQVQEQFKEVEFEDMDLGSWLSGDLAIRHAELGGIPQAFRMVQELKAETDCSWIMGRIAVEIAKWNPTDQGRLARITQMIAPLDQFWESVASN